MLVGVGGAFYDFTDNTVGNILGGSDEKTGFAGRTGGGLDIYLSNSLLLNAEATVLLTTEDFNTPVAGKMDDLYSLSVGVGLQYHQRELLCQLPAKERLSGTWQATDNYQNRPCYL